eukprot:gnl/TRDRNA2_/TRDRNA2_145245_c0_seq1.p2 gnl/TRDRNA2_/TRDRNA2_145245_c0~~gnl/TRDRNA2_/TRDRNA2_145245_c0_seq1.p2  ORF type:complete len:101 (+),score=9.06 gnl/TRDRNA2_/TRDRNA2_145245_c0_seq1:77-379(+)
MFTSPLGFFQALDARLRGIKLYLQLFGWYFSKLESCSGAWPATKLKTRKATESCQSALAPFRQIIARPCMQKGGIRQCTNTKLGEAAAGNTGPGQRKPRR